MQKIRILIYTDHIRIVDRNGDPTGIQDLIRFINHKAKGLVEVELTAINRHVSLITKSLSQGANKLSWGLLSGFDEIWMFGKRQRNLPADELQNLEPYNELDDYEVAVLESWMNAGGGLMFTGDHSEPNPIDPNDECAEPGHVTFLNLGKALGSRIPRAKQLRIWEGPPTYCPTPPQDNVNTQERGKCFADLDSLCHQYDDLPQVLLPISPAHKLFTYLNSNEMVVPITVLPDHMHEGKVLVPGSLDKSWPKDSRFPVVVAKGSDKRTFPNGETREYDLVVAYDGHPHKVGRIVADSSFHHFIDVNLERINGRTCCGTPVADTHLDQIAHYFINLVLWLAPQRKRNRIKSELSFRLAKHPDVLEAHGTGRRGLGQAARAVAEMEWGNSNLLQLLIPSTRDEESSRLDRLLSTVFFASNLDNEANSMDFDAVLGTIMHGYHDAFRKRQIHSPEFLDKDPLTGDEIVETVLSAFSGHTSLTQIVAAVEPAPTELKTARLPESAKPQPKETTTMAFKCDRGTWKSWLDSDPNDPPNDGFIDPGPILNGDGDFSGSHRRTGSPTRPIVGRCVQGIEHRIIILSFESPSEFHQYRGKITTVGTEDRVERGNGKHRRSPVPFVPLTEEDWDFSRDKNQNDDDWVAVKTT